MKKKSIRIYKELNEELRRYTKKVSKGYKKSQRKHIKEMIEGIVASEDVTLSGIISSQGKSEKELLYGVKRLSRQLKNEKWDEEQLLENHLKEVDFLEEETVIACDLTDIRKKYGEAFEYMDRVHDGSTGEIGDGYWAVTIEGLKSKIERIPLYFSLYSAKSPDFVSQWNEIRFCINKVVSICGKKGLWVMDRGFDAFDNFLWLNDLGLKFLIRLYHDRIVEFLNELRHIKDVRDEIQLKGEVQMYKTEVKKEGKRNVYVKKQITVKYGYETIRVFDDKQHEFVDAVLIVVEGIDPKERTMFLTNVPIETLKDCLKIVKLYARRYGVEEAIRFMKQSFNLENIRVLGYEAIKKLTTFCFLSYKFLCALKIFLSERKKKLWNWLLDFAPRINPVVNFDYYRIHEAVAKVLSLIFFEDLLL